MIAGLRALFLVVLASMLAVTTWAGLQCPLFRVPRAVATHPWFIATLFDAYWGFATFFVWAGWRQTALLARIGWFIAIMLLGNIAMSSYCLAVLWRAPAAARLPDLLVQRRDGAGPLGWILAGLGAAVLGLA